MVTVLPAQIVFEGADSILMLGVETTLIVIDAVPKQELLDPITE